jgi:nucleoside-triphosphatase THEP1
MPKIVVTGATGVGKTRLIQGVVEKLLAVKAAGIKAAGFYNVNAEDKKGKPIRVIRTLDGQEVPVATSGKGRGTRVDNFYVDADAIEPVTLEAISFRMGVDLYVIDEIGPMETISRTFSVTAKMLMKKDEVAVLASAAKQGRGFVREVKYMTGVEVHELTPENFAELDDKICRTLLGAFASRSQP